MSFPRTGEIWYRYDPDSGEFKYVIVQDVKGGTVFVQYMSNVADTGTFYPEFCRTLSDFRLIFTKQDGSWV